MGSVALAVNVEVEVVEAAWPGDGYCDCASVGGPEVAGEAQAEEEVVAKSVHRIKVRRTRRGIRVDTGCIERSTPGET